MIRIDAFAESVSPELLKRWKPLTETQLTCKVKGLLPTETAVHVACKPQGAKSPTPMQTFTGVGAGT